MKKGIAYDNDALYSCVNCGSSFVYCECRFQRQFGTIAIFPSGNQGAGDVGNVAVVISVSASTMRVKEGNFNAVGGTERECSTEGVKFIRP